jgi:hypothetical protein
MRPVVVASHLLGEGHFQSERFEVVPVECVGDTDYSRGLQAVWGTDATIVNVEHDHECSDLLIRQLLDCLHPLCTHAYKLYMASTGGLPHYAQRDGGPNYGQWITEGMEWCGFTGIGFCKITPQARVRPLVESPWQTVDCEVTKATDGPWHVHWQEGKNGPTSIEHYHR